MRSDFIILALVALLVWIPASPAMSAEPPARIEFLLHAIGQSGCVFTRNGKDHSATEAEDHLRMKYNRTKSRIKTAEAFIDHLASKSSWTGKPYTLRCADGEQTPSREWLYQALERYPDK